ncbi:hypothetical protein CR513_09302, partial [Mucuna pruriens]
MIKNRYLLKVDDLLGQDLPSYLDRFVVVLIEWCCKSLGTSSRIPRCQGGIVVSYCTYVSVSNLSEPFIVYSDAYKMGLSDVLMLKDLIKSWALIDKKMGKRMRQHKWLGFLKDYYFNLSHHLGKVDVVVNALSRVARTYQNLIKMFWWPSLKENLTTHYLEETTRIHGVPLSRTQVYLKILGDLPGALETKVKIDYKN